MAIRVGALVLLLIVAAIVAQHMGWFDFGHALSRIEELRRKHTTAGFAVLFVLLFGIVTALGVPATPFTVAAGALFGAWQGTLLAFIGAMISIVLGYWIARTVGRDKITAWMMRFESGNSAVSEARGFWGMVRIRLLPMVPLGLASFVSGLARAPFIPYLVASSIGVIPSIFVYAYFADALVGGASAARFAAIKALVAATVLLIGITLAPKLLRGRS
ncbi:MAG TPA: VTT domain-containing protein [Gemmatimonadaceae bacterium]